MAGGSEKKKFEFPECWNNDIRMGALFAPFRSKSVNPTDWDSKMKFWTSLIENWCKCNKCPTVEMRSLSNSFSRKDLAPACLEEVLQYLCSTGVLVNKDDFMQPNENWKNWAIKILVKNPIKWTFNTVKSTLTATDKKDIYYVHVPVVKYLSEELLKNVPPSSQEKIFNFKDLICSGYESSENLYIVLHWMQKQGQAAVCEVNGNTLVKFVKTASPSVKVTEIDLSIHSLKTHEKVLEESISKLYSERDIALQKTKQHLAVKMREMAKISLQRKKEIEKLIEKKAVILENIHSILGSIEQAKLDSEVIEAYQKGIATLKNIYKETGLNPQDVTATMDELEEVLNSRNEIDKALARPMDPDQEEDLEKELSELLLEDAPDVPVDLEDDKKRKDDFEKKENKKADEIQKKLEGLSI